MAKRDGDLVAGITAYADGPDEMREVINHHVKLGVDQVKLSMSGEEVFYFYLISKTKLMSAYKDHGNPFSTGLLLHRRGNSSLRR